MTRNNLSPPAPVFKQIMRLALTEDRAARDRTSSLLPPGLRVEARLVCREPAVLAGASALAAFGPRTRVRLRRRDGDRLRAGEIVAEIVGPARAVLSAERSVLNLISQLSGIATLTRGQVERVVGGSRTRLLDTRKTLPGLRALEKYAVRCGGGHNHRMHLGEMIFLKDNHLAAASLAWWRRRLARRRGRRDHLVVEVDRPEQIPAALALFPDRLLLDNMPLPRLRRSLALIRRARRRIAVEVSGGVRPADIGPLSRLGVDFISIGALTHSAPAADFSLEFRRWLDESAAPALTTKHPEVRRRR